MCNGTPYFVILDLFSVISCLSYTCVLLIFVSISIHLHPSHVHLPNTLSLQHFSTILLLSMPSFPPLLLHVFSLLLYVLLSRFMSVSPDFAIYIHLSPSPPPAAGVQAEGDAGNTVRGHLAGWFHRWPGHWLLADQGPHVRWRLGRCAVPLQVRLNTDKTHTLAHTHRACCVSHVLHTHTY